MTRRLPTLKLTLRVDRRVMGSPPTRRSPVQWRRTRCPRRRSTTAPLTTQSLSDSSTPRLTSPTAAQVTSSNEIFFAKTEIFSVEICSRRSSSGSYPALHRVGGKVKTETESRSRSQEDLSTKINLIERRKRLLLNHQSASLDLADNWRTHSFIYPWWRHQCWNSLSGFFFFIKYLHHVQLMLIIFLFYNYIYLFFIWICFQC